MRSLIFAILVGSSLLVSALATAGEPHSAEQSLPADLLAYAVPDANPCSQAKAVPAALRLPATVPPGEPTAIEKRMLAYLSTYKYQQLGWCVDKGVRDTGPYHHGKYYGTHPAVRIFYSPEMIAWLRAGKRGAPADGAVLIKEQYTAPAARWNGVPDDALRPTDWTIMIRRASASRDGWFWAEVYTPGLTFGGTQYPNAGFGIYCLRCHASADDSGTFSTLANISGFPGKPIVYHDDGSWKSPSPGPSLKPEHEKNLALLAAHAPMVATAQPLAMQTFPAEPLDSFVQNPKATHPFVTSDQCLGCHSGSTASQAFGPVMWLTGASPKPSLTPAANVSEYGEWRWSPMALAGRDPVFYAQLASELKYLGSLPPSRHPAALQQDVVNTCTQCHNVMGKRTFAIDHPGKPYSLSFVFTADPSHEAFHYGGLARDGVSCTVCHHAVASSPPPGTAKLANFLDTKINGMFDVGPSTRIYGPFQAVATHPMKVALGATPVFSKFVADSQLCGSCHTINLPVVDHLPVGHNVEQNTYVEWINSRYQTDYAPKPGAKSCQDCHMSTGLDDPQRGIDTAAIATKIALVEDDTYPKTEGLAPKKDVHVRVRSSGYHRHTLVGLNAFLLETAKQFPDALGLRLGDYMTSQDGDIDFAIDTIAAQARRATASVTVATHQAGRSLIVDVTVKNLTGHRFPSGVGFRRAFLDVEAVDGSASAAGPFFASGRTDANGRILGADGKPLPSESFAAGPDGRERYQEHHDVRSPIVSADQAQIFEELTQDADGTFTTSFIRRDHVVKDNRLLPQGWRKNGQPGIAIPAYFLEATAPHGRAASDPTFVDGLGHAVVRYAITVPSTIDPRNVHVSAKLYYQSWAPYFIAERTSGSDAASVRLRTLLSHLKLDGTPMQGWKLQIASASAGGVQRRTSR